MSGYNDSTHDVSWATGKYTKIDEWGRGYIITHASDPYISRADYVALCVVYGIPYLENHPHVR